MTDGRTLSLDVPVHYLSIDGPPERTFVLVHGLGGSHANFLPVLRGLSAKGRVLVPDLAGFGRTPRGDRPSTIDRHLALLGEFLDALCPTPVTLVGNSMGGFLSIQLAARSPQKVRDVVLLDPAVPLGPGARIDPATAVTFGMLVIPGLSVRMMQRRRHEIGPEAMVHEFLSLCVRDMTRIDPAVIDAHTALARERAGLPWADKVFVESARSLLARLFQRESLYARASSVRSPVLLVHGAHDRLISVHSAREIARRNPGWTYLERSDLGHVPQLEDPAWLVDEIHRWRDARPH